MKNTRILGGAMALLVAAGSASAQWSDGFEAYADGPLNSGGWDGWNGDPAAYGVVTSAIAHTGAKSIACSGTTDAVYNFGGAYTSGQWALSGYIYVPSNLDDETFWIIQNEYTHLGPYDWTVEVHLDPVLGEVIEAIQEVYGGGSAILPLVTDQWVEIRSEFDLDNNVVSTYYDGQLLATGPVNVLQGGAIEIANLDLYAPHAVDVYHDDLALTNMNGDPCLDSIHPNCDGNSTINALDFLCFLQHYGNGDPEADCDGNSSINALDWLCFLGAYGDCQ